MSTETMTTASTFTGTHSPICVVTSDDIPVLVPEKDWIEDQMTITKSAAYLALIHLCLEIGWPVKYPLDITDCCRRFLEEKAPDRFLLLLGPTSQHFVVLGESIAVERLVEYTHDPSYRIYLWDGTVADPAYRLVTFEEAKTFLLTEDVVRGDILPFTATFRVPTYDQLIASLPYHLRSGRTHDRRNVGDEVKRLHTSEMQQLFRYASYCSGTASVQMGLFEQHGSQWICNFSVADPGLPVKDEMNFHGQNTSRWKYAGAICVTEAVGDFGITVSSNH